MNVPVNACLRVHFECKTRRATIAQRRARRGIIQRIAILRPSYLKRHSARQPASMRLYSLWLDVSRCSQCSVYIVRRRVAFFTRLQVCVETFYS